MHVLTAFEYPSCNGGEHSWLATCELLQQAGVRYSAICPPYGPLSDRLRDSRIDVHPWRRRDDVGQPLSQERVRTRLAEVIRLVRPDLIHANSLAMSRVLGPVAAACGRPSLGHVRDIVKLSSQAMADVNQIGRVLAVSDATLRYHMGQGGDAGRWQVMYNGVDLDRFRPRRPGKAGDGLRRALRLDDRAFLLGTIGQIGMRKGLEVAAAALHRVMDEFEHVHWVIVGERNSGKDEAIRYEQQLLARARQRPLAGRVHLLGRRSDVPELLRSFDILLHTAHQEPLGRVLLEGAASGLAIIATDVGGTSEIFPPGSGTAVLTEANDVGAVTDAIGRLLTDVGLRTAMGQLARRRAEDVFSHETVAKALFLQYAEVVAGDRS